MIEAGEVGADVVGADLTIVGAAEPGAKFSDIVAGEVSIRRWPLRSGSEGRPEAGPG
jgi:hypothetical protein